MEIFTYNKKSGKIRKAVKGQKMPEDIIETDAVSSRELGSWVKAKAVEEMTSAGLTEDQAKAIIAASKLISQT